MENLQGCNAEDTCRVGNLKKVENKTKKKKKRREGGQILIRDIFDIKVRKNTKESVCLILADMHLLADILYNLQYSQNKFDTASI